MIPHVTLLYGALLGLLMLVLGLNVTRVRGKTQTWLDNSPPPQPLYLAIRAHGNTVEWAPITMFLILLVELSGGDARWVHALGGALVLGRALHGFGLLTGIKTAVVGSTLTYGVLGSAAAWALWLHFVK